jgi:hypothetical protein
MSDDPECGFDFSRIPDLTNTNALSIFNPPPDATANLRSVACFLFCSAYGATLFKAVKIEMIDIHPSRRRDEYKTEACEW